MWGRSLERKDCWDVSRCSRWELRWRLLDNDTFFIFFFFLPLSYLLLFFQGEHFGTTEATEAFFAMTRLFQSNDVSAGRLTLSASLVFACSNYEAVECWAVGGGWGEQTTCWRQFTVGKQMTEMAAVKRSSFCRLLLVVYFEFLL